MSTNVTLTIRALGWSHYPGLACTTFIVLGVDKSQGESQSPVTKDCATPHQISASSLSFPQHSSTQSDRFPGSGDTSLSFDMTFKDHNCTLPTCPVPPDLQSLHISGHCFFCPLASAHREAAPLWLLLTSVPLDVPSATPLITRVDQADLAG